MTGWRYRVTVHDAVDILALVPDLAEQAPPQVFCDDAGGCYFDEGPNPYTDAIERLLNRAGDEGWELVQVSFRPQQMIAFWKRPLA
jgi:hypothetical protein